ncbi:MAG: hypothetical protein GXP13_03125 [Gammaproteobacteria bacterium]|nr:hypothetical protein [Gammaproteobacteria bacterium]
MFKCQACAYLILLMSVVTTPLMAEVYAVQLDPAIILPEIAAESTYQGFKNKKQSVVNSRRIANRLSFSSSEDMRVGLLRYRDEKGKGLYGIGYRNQVLGQELSTVMNKKGLLFAVEKKNILYNFQIKNEEPERNRNSTYLQFSLTGYF